MNELNGHPPQNPTVTLTLTPDGGLQMDAKVASQHQLLMMLHAATGSVLNPPPARQPPRPRVLPYGPPLPPGSRN